MRRGLFFCGLLLSFTVWLLAAQPLQSQSFLVVAVQVGGREVGVAEILRTDVGLCLPLQELSVFSNFRWAATPSGVRLETPLGEAQLADEVFTQVQGERFLCEPVLREKLGVLVAFDAQTLTVTLDVPWSLEAPTPREAPLVPQFRPAGWGVSGFRAEYHVFSEGGGTNTFGQLMVSGRAGQGQWRVVGDVTAQGERTVREFLWVRPREKSLFFAGRSYIQVSPLLPGFDLVGAGLSWSNGHLPRTGSYWGGFTPFAGASLRTLTGPAPPGSFVKLRVDGTVVATQQVGLSGRYEFIDVPFASARGAANVEVEIYDRHNLLVPAEVRRELVGAWAWLLPAGRVEQSVGAGVGGLWGKSLLGEDALVKKASGFWRWRRGMTEHLTAEATVQAVGDRWFFQPGLAWSPWPRVFTAWEVGFSEKEAGVFWEGDAHLGKWQLLGRALYQPEGFGITAASAARHDYSLELRFRPHRRLEVGLWGRDVAFDGVETRWVRPTLAFSAGRVLFLRAFPDQFGDMLFFANSQPFRRLLLAASVAPGSRVVEGSWLFFSPFSGEFRTTWDQGGGRSRLTVTVGNRAASFWGLSARAGVAVSGGRTAPVVEVAGPLLGGLWARAGYLGIPSRLARGEKPQARVYLSVTADYALSGWRWTPARGLDLARETGGITGRVAVLGGRGALSLAGARVRVVGYGGAVTDAQGRFFVSSIPPGIYRVELDPERLPLELTPVQNWVVVEVQAGAVTTVDFTVRRLFGFAGQVKTESDQGVPSAVLELVDQGGKVVAQGVADQFGYFRFDQLEAGKYVLRVRLPNVREVVVGERTILLQDDFLFGQDVVVPDAAAPHHVTENQT